MLLPCSGLRPKNSTILLIHFELIEYVVQSFVNLQAFTSILLVEISELSRNSEVEIKKIDRCAVELEGSFKEKQNFSIEGDSFQVDSFKGLNRPPVKVFPIFTNRNGVSCGISYRVA